MKVFFENRHILLCSSSEEQPAYKLTANFSDIEHLRDFVMRFVDDKKLPDACIYASDVIVLKRAFLQLFRIINAAGGVIHDGDDEYLVIDRKGVPDLPKGKAEDGEGPVETAMREVEEETGLKGMNILDNVGDTYHTYYIGKELVLKRTVWFSMSVPGRPRLTPQTEEDITAARWVSRKQMTIEAQRTYKSLRDIFLAVGE